MAEQHAGSDDAGKGVHHGALTNDTPHQEESTTINDAFPEPDPAMEVMRLQGTPAAIEFIIWLHRLLGQPYTAAELVELVTIVTLRDRPNNINGYGIRCDRITLAVWADEQNLALFAPGVPMSKVSIRQLKPHYPEALEHLRCMGVLPSRGSRFIMVGR